MLLGIVFECDTWSHKMCVTNSNCMSIVWGVLLKIIVIAAKSEPVAKINALWLELDKNWRNGVSNCEVLLTEL